MKKLFLLSFFFLVCGFIYSQDTAKFSVDLTSNFLFRGICLSDKPNVQPVISLSSTKKDVTYEIGTFSSFSIDGSYKEVDLYGKIGGKHLSFTVTNYMLNTSNLFDYSKTTTNALELSLGYAFDFPLVLSYNTFVWGNDKDVVNKQLYSTYIEANYTFKNNLTIFGGVSPYKSMYSNNFGVVNTGLTISKSVIIDKFVLPIRTSVVVNPDAKVIFANVTFSF